MPDISKPSDLNKIWSQNGVNTAPTDVKINNGFVVEIPPFEWFNYIENKQDRAIAHINQHGIPVWDSVTEYQASKSFTMGANGRIYFCVATHTNQNPTLDAAETYWVDYHATGYVALTTSGTWAVPKILSLGIKKPKVTVVAAGGSGGSGTNSGTFIRGGGGGAGGAAIAVLNLTGITSVPYTVGVGGARRTGANDSGVAGGSSSFRTLSAVGGGGGIRYNSVTAPAGGYGGGATGGTLNLKGGDGSDGPFQRDFNGGSGDGGASIFGGGTRGSTSFITTIPAYGAGGGGGQNGSNPGAPGIIIIEW